MTVLPERPWNGLTVLDAFGCQGGAAMGYHLAGFRVFGVDKDPQPRYPFESHQGDAVEYIREHGGEFDRDRRRDHGHVRRGADRRRGPTTRFRAE